MTRSHYLLPNERMAFVEKIRHLEQQLTMKDEKLRKVEGDYGSLLENHVGVIMDNSEKDKRIKDMSQKLAEKDATIMALKKNINFKKLVI